MHADVESPCEQLESLPNAYPENGKLHKSPSSGPRSINMHQPRIGAFTLEIGVDASSPRRFLSLSLSLSFLPLSFSLPFFLRNRNPRRKRRYKARLFALLVAENTPPPISLPIYIYILIYINNQFRSTINDFRTKTAIQTLDIRNLSIPLVYKHRIRPCLG